MLTAALEWKNPASTATINGLFKHTGCGVYQGGLLTTDFPNGQIRVQAFEAIAYDGLHVTMDSASDWIALADLDENYVIALEASHNVNAPATLLLHRLTSAEYEAVVAKDQLVILARAKRTVSSIVVDYSTRQEFDRADRFFLRGTVATVGDLEAYKVQGKARVGDAFVVLADRRVYVYNGTTFVAPVYTASEIAWEGGSDTWTDANNVEDGLTNIVEKLAQETGQSGASFIHHPTYGGTASFQPTAGSLELLLGKLALECVRLRTLVPVLDVYTMIPSMATGTTHEIEFSTNKPDHVAAAITDVVTLAEMTEFHSELLTVSPPYRKQDIENDPEGEVIDPNIWRVTVKNETGYTVDVSVYAYRRIL